MYKDFKELGLYTVGAIEELQDRENIEITDCIEGCLIDSLLLYDNKADLYYMCMEYAQNEWTSCYKVSCGNEKIIYQKWDSIKESMEVAQSTQGINNNRQCLFYLENKKVEHYGRMVDDMDKHSIDYLSGYIKLTEAIKQKIEKHAQRYNIKAEICAWYSDWEDFCSDWCDDCGYTRTEARKLYHGGIGEFMKLPDGNGIVRFVIQS